MTAEILGRLGFDAASREERPCIAEDTREHVPRAQQPWLASVWRKSA